MPPSRPPRADIILGYSNHRYHERPFGMLTKDRLLHTYVIGQTGTGKSTTFFNLALQDADHGTGFCLIDPHGDLALSLHQKLASKHHYWDVADPKSPYGYNPLTAVSAGLRPLVADGLISALKKQWHDAWGPRMEHLLRQAILALLEHPGSDLRDIMRLFLDRTFREEVLARVSDPQTRHFWQVEYKAMNYRTAADGVAPLGNKLGALLAHPGVRTALCTPQRPLRLRALMDRGEALIVNLGKGSIGGETGNVLGGLLLASLVNAAFTRKEVPGHRRPFFVYCDEFHHFSSTTFADALSECRKYGLGVILSQQHTAQTDPKILAAILGNAGTVIALRIGALDAPLLTRQFQHITIDQLIYQPNHRAWVQMMVHGEKTKPFTARLLPPH